jgi:hypothetical protein
MVDGVGECIECAWQRRTEQVAIALERRTSDQDGVHDARVSRGALAEQAVKASSAAHDELWAGIPADTIEQASAALRDLFRT